MDRRIKSALAGLLICICHVWAQEEPQAADDVLILQTTGSPAGPVAGGYWTYTILADHPVTQEVTVATPVFPSAMILERVRTELRFVAQPAAGEEQAAPEPARWTAVEFLFSLQTAGTFTLNPFTVSAGDRKGTTAPFSLRVYAPANTAARVSPSFHWENVPAALAAGTEAELTLILLDWDPMKPVPRQLFRGRIPEKIILQEMPFIKTGSGNIHYPVKVIALEAGNFSFGPLQVQIEGVNLEIPGIKIPVAINQIPEKNISIDDLPVPAVYNPQDSAAELLFPSAEKKVFFPFRKKYEQVINEAVRFWNNGNYANALALVRSNERDRLFGPIFITIRKDMENVLGILNTPDEKWGFWNQPVFPWVCIFPVLISFWLVFRINTSKNTVVTFGVSKGFRSITIQIALGGAAVFLICAVLTGISIFSRDRQAILAETEAYRVPDSSGAVNTRFDIGQPVLIRSSPGQWYFIESADGRQGWVPAETVIPY